MLTTLIRAMAVMAGYPILIGLPVVLFGVLAWVTRDRIARWVAIAWALYGVYETLRFFRVLCLGECHERLDLIVVYPVLALASVVGLVAAALAAVRQALSRRG